MKCVFVVGVAALSRGFGKPPVKKKKKVDPWGVPSEDTPVPSIVARTRPLVAPQPLTEVDRPSNVVFEAFDDAWAPRLECLHLDPLVIRVKALMSRDECDRLVAATSSTRCKELPRDAGTIDSSLAGRRTSTTWYARFAEPEVAPLLGRAARLLGVDLNRFEEIQIARYRAGEQFKWHGDAVPPSMLQDGDGGQRLATLLVYLSGDGRDARGGATCFRDCGPLKVNPVKGDALLFFPANRAGVPDDRVVHAAEPVLKGEKWVSQLWLHQFTYPATIFDDNVRTPDLERTVAAFSAPPLVLR